MKNVNYREKNLEKLHHENLSKEKNLECDTFWSIIKRFKIIRRGPRGLFTYITYIFRPATLLKRFQHM